MPNSNTDEQNPPASWEEFEDICADLFAREWRDEHVVRYGRQGQRQHGVDIKGSESGKSVGAQCKKKRKWPPTKLTKAEVTAEVREAKKFRPKLKKYIIATTANDDVAITDHVNAITARHAKQKLFSVHVYSWREILRRIRDYPDLLEKHFDAYVLRQARDDIRSLPGRIVAAIQSAQSVQLTGPQGRTLSATPPNLPFESGSEDGLAEALERDFANRFDAALKRCHFPEAARNNELVRLADGLLAKSAPLTAPLKRSILLRAARHAAVQNKLEQARGFLDAANGLPGPPLDVSARARLAAAEGKKDESIRILRDLADSDSRSTLLDIIAREHGDQAALAWVEGEKIGVPDLTANGVVALAQILLREGKFEQLRDALGEVTRQQLLDSPYLYFLRGGVRLATLLGSPDRHLALQGVPLDVRFVRPILSGEDLTNQLDEVINDFRQAMMVASTLNLPEAVRIIEGYLIWCDLLHPARTQAAVARLRREMQDLGTATLCVSFAFAYDSQFDPKDILAYLARRDSLGGLSRDELHAVLSIHVNRNDPKGIAELIARHRGLAEQTFGKQATVVFEIQALARSGDATSAKIARDKNLSELAPELLAAMNAEIAKAEGADPVTEHLRLYETTKEPEALRQLLAALIGKKDHLATARYAELLYEQTQDPRDLALAARALIEAGDDLNFVRLYEAFPFVKNLDPGFKRHYGWQLFRRGRQAEARQIAEEIARDFPQFRDLNLEIAIDFETGEWERLAEPLAAFLQRASELDGPSLMRAATLAQTSGQGPFNDLLEAAIKKSENDPNVLLGGFTLLVEEGLEEKKPEAQAWFTKALSLSGPEGPIQRFELKEMLERQVEWNDRNRLINDHVTRGDMPMVIAGTGLHTTVVNLVLRNLIRNSELGDARRRIAIPLFSGRRLPEPAGKAAVVAFDITALLVLGWLGLLEKAFGAYAKIVVPAGAMMELFEGRRRIRHAQRSRLGRAEAIRQAVADERLRVLRSPALPRDTLSSEIGHELAALLREAESTDGVVIRPAPVKRLGTEEGDADLTDYQVRLCDMDGLLGILIDLNAIDEATESSARQYFALQDEGWPNSATPDPKKPVFVDGVALAYLQYTGLLEPFLRTFPLAHIHESTDNEAATLIEHDRHAVEVFRVIDDIRAAVRVANAAGRVVFGSRRVTPTEADESRDTQSTINLLSDFSDAEITFFDDRFLNKEGFCTDERGRRVRSATSLDLLEELRARGVIDEQERRTARYRLRSGGAMLIPVDADEVAAAASRNRQNEAPEFRAMHDSLDLARVSEIPQFPGEMPWFIAFVHATKGAITRVWNSTPDTQRASAVSRAILALHPLAEEWIGRWGSTAPPEWVPAVTRAMIGALALPFEVNDPATIEVYQQWFETEVMADIRERSPQTYEAVIAYLRQLQRHQARAQMAKAKSDLTPAQLAKLRTLFLLRRLSPVVQNDVLADGSVVTAVGLDVSHPIKFSDALAFERRTIFGALQKLADGRKPPTALRRARGGIIKVKFELADTDAVLRFSKSQVRIPYAALLAATAKRRKSVLAKCLTRHTLSSHKRQALRALIEKKAFGEEDFIAASAIFAGSLESYASTLRQQAQTGRLSKSDFLPAQTDYWDNLAAPSLRSDTLPEFIADELAIERQDLLSRDPSSAIDIVSLSFGAPELVPLDLLKTLDDDIIFRSVESLLTFGDPVALSGAFAVCADRLASDDRFAQLGDRVLDRLFADPTRLLLHLETYGAAFVIATAHLAEHQALRKKPVFWRRLAAAAHAAVVARTLGEASPEGETLLTWSMRMSGRTYYLSVVNDAVAEPRWRPDWIDAPHLAADIFGRVAASAATTSVPAPRSWADNVAKAKQWIDQRKLVLASTFPSILQGAAPPPADSADIGAEFYDSLIRTPTIEAFVILTPLVWTLGFQERARGATLTALRLLRTATAPKDPDVIERALALAASIATQTKDVEIADTAAQLCVERLVTTTDPHALLAFTSIVIECAAADRDRERALASLALRLENVAFTGQSAVLDEFLVQLRVLRSINEPLGLKLGRAFATARLGRSRVAS